MRCLLIALLIAPACVPAAWGDEREKLPPVVDLKGGKIADSVTTVSFPVDATQSLVLGLHEGYWLMCPRVLPVPTCLTGEGLILEYLLARGGSPTQLYVGVEPLPPPLAGEAPAARLERAARAFVATLGEKYLRVDFQLMTQNVTLAPTTLKVGGKKTPAWRTSRYDTQPAVAYGGPESVLVGECVLLQPAGIEALVYVALNMKASGTTLDRALQNVSFQPTSTVNKAGRVVQLNNLYEGEPGRFPVRLVRYTSPVGFVIAPSVLTLSGVVVYAEDRLDAQGKVTGAHRILQRVADKDVSPAKEADDIRHGYARLGAGDIQELALATPRVKAYVFPHKSALWGEENHARTAVVRLDDLTLEFTWSTRGDAALAALDAAAFTQLLQGMELAVRW